jgi:diguanylate cyclase (GGDEF)-like protein
MIDLDDFKTINDSFGHQAGDTVLIEFSQCLKKAFNEEKLIARYGGDEFFVVVEKLNPASIQKRLTSLKETLKENLVFKNVNFSNFSVGMSDYDGNKTIDEIFLEADQRMYKEKPNS